MEIIARTRTPIWTGGADQDSDKMRESGIVGSMRFWYEGLLRARGRKATESEDLFGNTTHSRLFRIHVEGLHCSGVMLNGKAGKQALWSDDTFLGTIVRAVKVVRDHPESESAVELLLHLAAQYSAGFLSAKQVEPIEPLTSVPEDDEVITDPVELQKRVATR